MKKPRILTPPELDPVPRYANYIPVTPGQTWGPRTLTDTEFVLVIAGRFHYTDPAGDHEAGPGDVIFIPPAVVHSLRHSGGGAPRFSCIHSEPCDGQRWIDGTYRLQPAPLTVTSTALNPELHDLFRRCAEAMHRYSVYSDAIRRAICRQVWLLLAEYWDAGDAPRLTPRVQQMLSFLNDHLTEPVSRRDLARQFHLTPEYVNALFKKELGISPTAFVHRERCLRARHLLADQGLSVKEAAAAAGFDDVFYFSRTFRKVMGIPPSRA